MQIVIDNSVDIEGARAWLVTHKEDETLSWPALGKLTDVADSTLSLFASGSYRGSNEKVAGKVLAYRARLDVQAKIGAQAPAVPSWYETQTATQLTGLLQYAQTGRIVLIVTAPGIGKTRVAERLADADPNVWLATMSPATAGVATMASEVAEAIGLGEITGSPQQLSRKIRAHISGKKGLLIIDEAQELNDKALNEIRGWHDRTKVGVALLGNDKVVGQLDSRKSALAQVSSRFSYRHVQYEPLPGDIEALLSAWSVTDAEQATFLRKIGALPGALRELTHILEIASLTASGAGQPISIAHLRDAAKRRNFRAGGR
ncbi:AAA family ATPase [Sphingomonas sp. SRS2]|uniref:AAA family ATPase n=1 Tax=Sphingomonas sp. SRS2 TaxID=133190 RepID=UPI000618495D|nr:AAA family ATPase [Sphingomonas sp. SRS2]KKC24868.1 hypothetical protein WP12_16680 [Sphingomonas sp. SRS2]